MKMRKIVSLTGLTSFILLIVTSVILYIVPHGRVAYWAGWHLWGLTKTEWGNIHINLGILLLSAICLHIYYNWKSIMSYLKDKTRHLQVFTREFNVAIAISFLFIAGTYFEIPPFSSVIELSNSIKESAARKYGEPPYGHAELSSLKAFASKTGLDLSQSLARLKKAGIRFETEKQTLKEIAELNNISPRKMYSAMKPGQRSGEIKRLENAQPRGMGKRTLTDICQEYNLSIRGILRGLNDNKVKASAEMTLKEIAEQNDISPHEVYAIIIETAHTGQ